MLGVWYGLRIQNRRLSFQRGTFRLGPHDILAQRMAFQVSAQTTCLVNGNRFLHTVVIQRYIDINNVPILQLALIGYSMAYGLIDRSERWDRLEG